MPLQRRSTIAPLLPLLSLVVAACSSSPDSDAKEDAEASIPFASGSPWPKFRGDAAQTGRSRLGLGPSSPSIDRAARPWTVSTAKGIFSSPVIDAEGTVYIGSADRTFYAIGRDGTVRWKILTGEIVDSAALLDDHGHVYFGSGDGVLRAVDAKTGAIVWTRAADDPSVNKAFINWFEGNVAIGPSGTLYVPNDNFFLYSIDRDTGDITRRAKMPDQTWSLPAVDAVDETLFVGNNNVLPTLGRNTFAFTKDGETAWASSTLGSVAASPMIDRERQRVVVGAFDGFVRSYDKASGEPRWEVPTRDHVYASASLMADGTIIQPSSDGTVYALDPETGAIKWTFDTNDSIRSSASIDGEGNIYFGGGDGRLWALKPDGTLRWWMQLIDADRNDLNASPALGREGIVIAGESGEIFSVPWDWCLREGATDARCGTTMPSRAADEVTFRYVTPMGATLETPPKDLDGNEPLILSLSAREHGRALLATIDSSSLHVTSMPAVDLEVRTSGDGRFLTIAPKTTWPTGSVSLDVTASWLRDHQREGLRLSGGTKGGEARSTIAFNARSRGNSSLNAAAPGSPTPSSVWEIARLALPLPTLMPSYNQIGFDSLHYLVTVVEMSEKDKHGVAWMIGAKLAEQENTTVIDPTTRALFPLELHQNGDLVTFSSSETLRMEVMNIVVPFDAFRISARLTPEGGAAGVAHMAGASVCGTVPFYGPFLQKLGLCNPQTDELVVVGGAELRLPKTKLSNDGNDGLAGDPIAASAGNVTIVKSGDAVTATLEGSRVRAKNHVVGLLLVDASTGRPVALDYGIDTKRDLDAEGNVVKVTLPAKKTLPASLRAHVLVDTRLVATKTL